MKILQDGFIMIFGMKKKTKSIGLGDTIAKITEATGIDKLVEKTTEMLGIEDCGCSRRQELLNNLIPYSSFNPPPKELTSQNGEDFSEGVYLVNNNLVFTREGVTYDYKVGQKIYIDKNNPYFTEFKQYYELGIITKK